MDLAKFDLNLLVVFDAMVRHGNVTAAGSELGSSQPAASDALAKMRKAFEDPLFVRIGSRREGRRQLRDAAHMPDIGSEGKADLYREMSALAS